MAEVVLIQRRLLAMREKKLNISHTQCDQIAILFVQYLTINSSEKLPNGIEKLPRHAKHNAKY